MKMPKGIRDLGEKLAGQSQMNQKLAAVIFDNRGTVLSTGVNYRTTALKRFGMPYLSVHAEVDAIHQYLMRNPAHQLSGKHIYIHRKNNRLARPCQQCMALIHKFGLIPHWSE